jgi:alcohol dehydrogenase YqhD (iron-dependent ADH family)
MDNFVFNLPTKIVFGKGEFQKLGEEAKLLGKKAMLITGRHFAKKSGLLDKAEKMLKENGIDVVEFCEIEPNPESETVNKGGRLAREEKVDFLIGLGGGSVIDAAKGISVVAVTNRDVWDFCEKPPKAKVPEKTLPILAVITVAATGSEADSGGVITNTKTRHKRAIFGRALFPTTSIVDPLLTLTVPQKQTIDGVIDMITHIFESYLSSKANAPVSDRVSEGLIKEAMKQGEIVFNDLQNIEARESLSWISTLALSGFPSAGRRGPFPMHRMEHPISGLYRISHGRGLAAIMPAFLYHTKDMHAERLKTFGKNVLSTDSPTKTIERIVHWMKKVDAFVSLKDLGVKYDDIEKLADMAIEDDGNKEKGFIAAREPLSKEMLMKIYTTAYNYKDLFRKA